MSTKIQLRRGTATQWTTANPVLAAGEVGYETDTGNIKVGTGTAGSGAWNNLPYYQLPNVSVNPTTSSDLNATNYQVMGRYRLNTITSGMTLVNGPSDLDPVDADSVCTLLVTTHAYDSLTTHVQQTLTQFSASATSLKQWVRLYNGTNWTAWTSTAHLSDNEVTTAKIADATDASTGVTNSKLRQSGALSVIGRSANSLGAPADISATAGSGAVLRESGSAIGFGTISADGIAADAVTTAKILNGNVTTLKIADDAVTAAKLADDASVDANRAVTTNHIRDSAVTTAKIANANVTNEKLASDVTAAICPVGSVLAYAGSSAPTGWLLCNGQAVSRTTYSLLFAAISTTFGAGNGSTTFNVPDLRNKFAVGVGTTGFTVALGGTGGTKDAIVVSHTHTGTTSTTGAHTHTFGFAPGSTGGSNYNFTQTGSSGTLTPTSSNGNHSHTFTTESSGSSGTDQNLPPYVGINYIIRGV